MQFWVYLLRCRDGSFYTGHTDNLEKRLIEHAEGLAADWTRRRLPVESAWCESAPTREEALAFERRVKNWTRAKKEALVAGDWEKVGHFARPPHERPSTWLGTNEMGVGRKKECPTQTPFIPSEVEGRTSNRGEAQ